MTVEDSGERDETEFEDCGSELDVGRRVMDGIVLDLARRSFGWTLELGMELELRRTEPILTCDSSGRFDVISTIEDTHPYQHPLKHQCANDTFASSAIMLDHLGFVHEAIVVHDGREIT